MFNQNEIGRRIFEVRKQQSMTQDDFGKKYSISGPAVFKFEKGKVKPSLELWLKMARDMGIPEARAVLIWSREKLPERYRDYIDVNAMVQEVEADYGAGQRFDYTKVRDRKALKKMLGDDPGLPLGLREFLEDQDLWTLYKPTGQEIQAMKKIFSGLGAGSADLYREALRLIREFGRA